MNIIKYISFCILFGIVGNIHAQDQDDRPKPRPIPIPIKVPKAIDLGLPSGTKWAEWNVGASSPEQPGNYYAWGETEPKSYYFWNYFDVKNKNTKEDEHIEFKEFARGKRQSIIGTKYDVAHVKWGKSWQMPTEEQYRELINYCTIESVKIKGKSGMRFTGPNKNYIFIPAGGFIYKSILNDKEGYEYWIGEFSNREPMGDEYANSFCEYPRFQDVDYCFYPRLRRHGALVRAVWCDEQQKGKDDYNVSSLLSSPITYQVSFSCNVPSAKLSLDGVAIDSISKVQSLKTGTHVVKCSADGYESFTDTIMVKEGTNSCSIKLKLSTMRPLAEAIKKYKVLAMFHDGLAAVKKEPSVRNARLIFLNKYANKGIPLQWGFINKNGIEVIPCQYDDVKHFSEGVAAVKNGKWGFINKNGEIVIKCVYDSVGYFNEGFAPIQKKSKWGFINMSGKEIVPCKYDAVGKFYDGLAVVRKGMKYGIIDNKGKEKSGCKHQVAIILPNGNYMLGTFPNINEYPAISSPALWDFPSVFKKYDVVAYISPQRQIKVFHSSDIPRYFYIPNGLLVVGKNGAYGLVDTKCKEQVPCKYQYIDAFSENIAVVKKDGKFGFLSVLGKEIIPCQYENVMIFSNNLAPVKDKEKWGFINKEGIKIIPCLYDEVTPFSDELAAGKKDGKWGYIDKKGNSTFDF